MSPALRVATGYDPVDGTGVGCGAGVGGGGTGVGGGAAGGGGADVGGGGTAVGLGGGAETGGGAGSGDDGAGAGAEARDDWLGVEPAGCDDAVAAGCPLTASGTEAAETGSDAGAPSGAAAA